MNLRAVIIAAMSFLPLGAVAQEAPPPAVRVIAPDKFQPNFRDGSEPKPASALAAPPTKEHPLGNCDRASRTWLNCLRATVDLSAALVSAAESQVVASLGRRKTASASLQRMLTQALADADAKWLELRELECNQLALLEVAQGTQLYEAQLICRINHNLERIDRLTRHYGAGAA